MCNTSCQTQVALDVNSTNVLILDKIRQVAADYKGDEGSLIQILHTAQSIYGYLPLEVQKVVASELDIPLSTVSGVVSFYSFFTTEPKGKHTIRICLGTACYVRGGVTIAEAIEKRLNVKVGHTTDDGMFTFEIARCIGACGLAPAMVIDDVVYSDVSSEKLDEIFKQWYEAEKEGDAV